MKYNIAEIHDKYLSDGISKTAKYYNKSQSWVRWILNKHNLPLLRVGKRSNKVNDTYFSTMEKPAKAYYLGLLAADGYISKTRNTVNITLKNEDSYLLDLFRNELEAHNDIKRYGKYARFEVSSPILKADLAKYGVTPQKTYTLIWPDIKEELYPHYIRGFIDGDGCWFIRSRYKTKPTLGLQIVSASKDFLLNLQKKLSDNTKIKNKVPYKIKTSKCYELKYCGNNLTRKIKEYIYPSNMGKFYMKRKYNICTTVKT